MINLKRWVSVSDIVLSTDNHFCFQDVYVNLLLRDPSKDGKMSSNKFIDLPK